MNDRSGNIIILLLSQEIYTSILQIPGYILHLTEVTSAALKYSTALQ